MQAEAIKFSKVQNTSSGMVRKDSTFVDTMNAESCFQVPSS